MNSNRSDKNNKEYIANEGRTDYVVTHTRRTNIIAYVLSLIAAVVLWSYVTVNQQVDTSSVVFNSLSLEFIGESDLKNQYGLIVQTVSEDSLSVSMTGKSEDVKNLNSSSIRLFVDLSEQKIDSAGTYEFKIHSEIPEGFDYVLSANKVQVSVDKPETKVLEVDRENIQLNGLVRETGCTIVDRFVNITKVTLEGNTTNLSRVAGVQIRTDTIGMISSSHVSVPAHVYLLDDTGKELDLPISVTTDAPNREIEVTLTAYMEKEVELTVDQLNGFLKGDDIIRITPSKVRVYGELDLVNNLQGKISLYLPDEEYVTDGKLNEKKLLGDTTLTNVGLNLPTDGESLTVTQIDGSEYTGATVNIHVSDLRTEILQLSRFELGGTDRYAVVDPFLSVSFRAIGSGDEMDMLIAEQSNIVLHVNVNTYNSETGKATVVVLIPDQYRSYVYEVGSYEVQLIPVTPTDADDSGSVSDAGE
ncbi:MAG: YbbR-like domain-containing protein [Eubacteriales bacterium]